MGFIEDIASLVQKYAPQYGIKVCSPIIAMAILESGQGTSDKVQLNGDWRHNYFGLKWRDKRCAISNEYFEEWTREQNKDGSFTKIVSKFCRFKSMEDCVIGFFQWTNIPNYANIKNVSDPKTFLKNIRSDGYSTLKEKDYIDRNMNIISRYNLTKYDIFKEEKVMSNSDLITYTKLSPNKTSPRNHKIDTISIHCMAGQLSVESCGALFAKDSTMASSNYGIGTDGRIALYVNESDRSWCTSNSENDHRAITIECASDKTHPYAVNNQVYTSLISLLVDICKRNGIPKLVWSTNKEDRVNHRNGCNMTVHRDYKQKACPGDYLYNLHGQIASEVNNILSYQGTGTKQETTPVKTDKSNLYRVQVGAFSKKENAIALLNKLKKAGFDAFITDGGNSK